MTEEFQISSSADGSAPKKPAEAPAATQAKSEAPKKASVARKGVIRISYANDRDLYQSYMPFIEGCGLFYPTEEQYPLFPAGGKDSEVFVMINIPEDKKTYSFAGRVVWLNPPKAQMKRVPGIGIQLTGKGVSEFKETLEKRLEKMLKTGLPTMTL